MLDLILCYVCRCFFFFFFFQAEDGIRDLTVTGVQTCALPISTSRTALQRIYPRSRRRPAPTGRFAPVQPARPPPDRKSTRLNSSHSQISYAVFCLKKKNRYPFRVLSPASILFGNDVGSPQRLT